MKRFIGLLVFIFTFSLIFPALSWGSFLRVGDILLQPLSCWACRLIEMQEETIYSHMGMVIRTHPEVIVAEAFDKVRKVKLSEFAAKTKKGEKISIRRFIRSDAVEMMELHQKKFEAYFFNHFEGLNYDHEFLWNNFDHEGFEKLYCSELVSKMLSGFLGIHIPVKKMKFDKNREHWIQYFKGNPPDGLPGNSPATFEHSELFFEVGEL
jgi:hypothetical protein